MTLLYSLARDARVAALITDSDAEALLRAEPVLYLREGRLVAPQDADERGRLYRFPAPPDRRRALMPEPSRALRSPLIAVAISLAASLIAVLRTAGFGSQAAFSSE